MVKDTKVKQNMTKFTWTLSKLDSNTIKMIYVQWASTKTVQTEIQQLYHFGIMVLKMVLGDRLLNVFLVYAPHSGRPDEKGVFGMRYFIW